MFFPRPGSGSCRYRTAALLLAGALIALGAAAAEPASDPEPVTVTYLANEGFLISAGEDKILIDALFPGITHYARLTGRVRADLLSAAPPFDDVDVALASHYHDDHFGPDEVLAFLRASPASVLVSTPQALARLEQADPAAEEFGGRLYSFHPAEGSRETFRSGSIVIEILNLHHGRGRNPPVQNLGFVIDLDGFRVLHVGDTEISLTDLEAFGPNRWNIDLALLPGWLLAEPGWAEVTKAIAPRAIAAMHLAEPSAPASWFGSAGSSAGRKQRMRTAFPTVWIPETALESRTFERSGAP